MDLGVWGCSVTDGFQGSDGKGEGGVPPKARPGGAEKGPGSGGREQHSRRAAQPPAAAASPRPLRLGISTNGPSDPDSWRESLDFATRAEALGYESLWLPENHFQPGATASPLLALAAVAARTETLRLATTSILIPVHDPRRVAAEVATLDQLSGGRVIFGVGRGFDAFLFRTFGVDPKRKRDRFESALDAILAAWSGAGDDGAAPLPRPLQRPHPPIVVAAFGPKGLRQAARRGLPYLASPLERLDALAENYAHHREEMGTTAQRGALDVPVMRTLHVAGSAAEADRARAAAAREFGNVAERVGRNLAAKASGDVDERVIVGEVAQVVDQLELYRQQLGMNLLVARSAPGTDRGERFASLERLALEVLPRLSPAPRPG